MFNCFECLNGAAEAKKGAKKTTWGSGGLFGNRALGSLILMLVCPAFVIISWYTCKNLDGHVLKLFSGTSDIVLKAVADKSPMILLKTWYNNWPNPFNAEAWKFIGSYMAFELLLMRLVPGEKFSATKTATGHVPEYIANGFQCYLISVVAVIAGGYYGYLPCSRVYDMMGELLSAMNIFAICFCLFLTVKGLNFPSTKDSGSNGNLIIDFFWGTELYPRILGWDLKQFTNCRFGMMFWQLGLICYAFKQYDLYHHLSSSLLASVLIQSAYIAKFFWWETGYFCSMDIQHDRAGYYICWGCLVWVPSMYTIHSFYMVQHPLELSPPVFAAIVVCGVFCIWCNYDCDRQRQEFRAKNGKMKIWGRDPVHIIARYKSGGQELTSLLLADGWWGLARHFHYIPEIAASFFWCLPAMNQAIFPYFYPVYLTLLLLDRAWRDDARCAEKYKASWVEYCQKVPSKIIPGII